MAREGTITARDGLDSKKSTKWHFSLLQELRTEDVPSSEREYYNLTASYKVHIRPQRAPGGTTASGASGTTTASASTERSSARHLLGFEECDYDIGGLSSISSNNNSGEDHSHDKKGVVPRGHKDSSQRAVISRRATSANNSSRTPRAQRNVGDSPSTTTTTNASPPKHVRGFEDWLKTHSPQASPKKQYAFGNAPRFQEHAISSSSTKEDEERSPAALARIASPRTQTKHQNGNTLADPEPPVSELPLRPQSAFGRTLHTAFSSRKMTFSSGSSSAAMSNNSINSTSNAPQQQSNNNNSSRVNPTRTIPIAATPVRANAAAAAVPPPRPKTVCAASANARSRNRASLKLQQERALRSIRKQQHKELFAPFGSSSKSRFGPESPYNSTSSNSFNAPFGSASTLLHPKTSTPLVYPTSPRFSMVVVRVTRSWSREDSRARKAGHQGQAPMTAVGANSS